MARMDVAGPDDSPRTTRCCWSPSAARSGPRTSCRSWRTSPAAAASRASASRRSASTTSASGAGRRSTTRTAPSSRRCARTSPAPGIDLPVYWGNRNWDPYLADALTQMRDDGVTRAACFITSAYSSYSGCRQYRENLADAVAAVEGAPGWTGCATTSTTPASWRPSSTRRSTALAELPDQAREGAHLVFVTHSIPDSMNDAQRPGRARRLRRPAPQRRGRDRRPGAPGDRPPPPAASSSTARAPARPQVPWLEPDINDHLEALAKAGVPGVVIVPVGFVSDHMEVVYDLDTEAARHRRAARAAGRARRDPGHRPALRGHGPRPAARAGCGRTRRGAAATPPWAAST